MKQIYRCYLSCQELFTYTYCPLSCATIFGCVGPPLVHEAYSKMTNKQWIQSMLIFDENYDPHTFSRGFLRGGLVEHSRAFGNIVRSDPRKYISLVFEVAGNKDISRQYLAEGIGGLIGTYDDYNSLKLLLMSHYEVDHYWCCNQFIELAQRLYEMKQSKDLLEVIAFYFEHGNRDKENSWQKGYYGGQPLTAAINTTRGSAIWALSKCAFNTEFPDYIFEVFESSVNSLTIATRVCMVSEMAGLINYDSARTMALFNELTSDNNPIVIEAGIRTLYYLMNEFDSEAFCKMTCLIDSGYFKGDDSPTKIGRFCLAAMYRKLPKCGSLIHKWISLSSATRKCIITPVIDLLNDPDETISSYSLDLLTRIMSYKDENASDKFDYGFHKATEQLIIRHMSFLRDYIKTGYIKGSSYHFLQFLLRMSAEYPENVFELVQDYSTFEVPSLSHNSIEEELVNIYINIYNYTVDQGVKANTILLFDNILKDDKYQFRIRKVLDQYDSR